MADDEMTKCPHGVPVGGCLRCSREAWERRHDTGHNFTRRDTTGEGYVCDYCGNGPTGFPYPCPNRPEVNRSDPTETRS